MLLVVWGLRLRVSCSQGWQNDDDENDDDENLTASAILAILHAVLDS